MKNTAQLFIIGYSMPRSDALARFLLSFFRPDASHAHPKVVILTNSEGESDGIWKQVYEVGGFGKDDVPYTLMGPASTEKYQELLAHAA